MIKIRNKILAWKKGNHNVNIKRLYNLFKNRVSRELKKRSKKWHYSQFFEENKMSIKKISSGIREIVNIRNSKPHQIAQLKVDGKIISKRIFQTNLMNSLLMLGLLFVGQGFPQNIYVTLIGFSKGRFVKCLVYLRWPTREKLINKVETGTQGTTALFDK